jgi:hypothetical protein
VKYRELNPIMPKALFVTVVFLSMTPRVFADGPAADNSVSFSDGTTDYAVIQLVRYVLDSSRPPGIGHHYSVMRGTVQFGDKYYHPFDPLGPVIADCHSSRMLGVQYVVRRDEKAQYRRKKFRVQFVWSHSAVAASDERLERSHLLRFRQGQTRAYRVSFLELPDAWKVNGLISIEATIGTDVILRNSFELSGCANDSPTE